MYKSIKLGKYKICFHKFPKTAKNGSEVYLSGIRNWESFEFYAYSIVLWTFRIIFYINKPNVGACNGH